MWKTRLWRVLEYRLKFILDIRGEKELKVFEQRTSLMKMVLKEESLSSDIQIDG